MEILLALIVLILGLMTALFIAVWHIGRAIESQIHYQRSTNRKMEYIEVSMKTIEGTLHSYCKRSLKAAEESKKEA